VRTIQQVGPPAFGSASDATDRTGALNLFESAAVGDVLGTGTPDVVKYELSLAQAANLLLVGQNFPYNHLIGAFDGSTGLPLPAFPTVTDDYQLLSQRHREVDPTLPTNQSWWARASACCTPTTAGRATTCRASEGDRRLAVLARRVRKRRADGGHHARRVAVPVADRSARLPAAVAVVPPRPTGQRQLQPRRYGRPRGVENDFDLAGRRQVPARVHGPGNDGPCGTPARYIVRLGGQETDVGLGSPAAGGTAVSREVTLPAGTKKLSLQAEDAAGNLGPAVVVKAK